MWTFEEKSITTGWNRSKLQFETEEKAIEYALNWGRTVLENGFPVSLRVLSTDNQKTTG